jgi:FKBP-type peptidyl-prolyl cis-trans isomerase FklB
MKLIPSLLLLLSCLTSNKLVSAGTNEAGLAFLKENKSKPGVITLPSGLQYKVLNAGSGTSHPTVSSPCKCNYEGTSTDGTKFDSSYDRGEPTTFAPNQVIAGWTEAMQLMVEGDKWEMYIPSDLAYGDRGSPPKIGAGEALVFQMEILEILGDKVDALKCLLDGTETDCNEKEVKFIEKCKAWEATKVESEIARLSGMQGNPMKDDLREWLGRRLHILRQVSKASSEEEL